MKCYKKDYPRPQFVREEWENLNGPWDFAFDDENCGERDHWHSRFPEHRAITVPYTYETKLSGIGDETRHDVIWYRRELEIGGDMPEGRRAVLHFEGSDYATRVWVNGQFAGEHTGAYERFSFDVTNCLKAGENVITVRVEDSFNTEQPRGKQRWEADSFGCWYVQTTGIWKTVWIEYVPDISLASVKMTPLLSQEALDLEVEVDAKEFGPGLTVEAVITYDGVMVNQVTVPMLKRRTGTRIGVYSEAVFEWGIKTWSPEHPDLYDIRFRVMKDGVVRDEVFSYFGMREIRIKGSNILLNGAPLYQRLVLDQGYWRDSHLTPPDEDALVEDIDKILALGYNGVRKHQKIEDERFLYWCDKKGLLVWSEMGSSYVFSDEAVRCFTDEWIQIVKQNYNHPSIIVWTPFNESWGIPRVEVDVAQQKFTESIYHLTKTLDPYRPVIVNDGWEHTVSDILTLHDYEESAALFEERYCGGKDEIMSSDIYHNGFKGAMADGYRYRGQPVIISEFGGIAFNNDDSGWGYGNKVGSEQEFIKRFDEITTAVKSVPYVCGYCYTQVTDVQQEINGLMDIDRNFKVDPQAVKEINQRPGGRMRLKY